MNDRGFFGVAVYRPKREVNVGTLWRSAATYGAALVQIPSPAAWSLNVAVAGSLVMHDRFVKATVGAVVS